MDYDDQQEIVDTVRVDASVSMHSKRGSVSPINKQTLFVSNNFEDNDIQVDPSITQKQNHRISEMQKEMIISRKLSQESSAD